jgi:hypothetical protein
MERMIERCCALDVHKRQVTACVHVPDQSGKRGELRAEFSTMTPDLLALRARRVWRNDWRNSARNDREPRVGGGSRLLQGSDASRVTALRAAVPSPSTGRGRGGCRWRGDHRAHGATAGQHPMSGGP